MTIIGARVRVYDDLAPKPIFLGYGTYKGRKRIQLYDLKTGKPSVTINTPKIKMDNGKTIYGYKCWWFEDPDFIH